MLALAHSMTAVATTLRARIARSLPSPPMLNFARVSASQYVSLGF